MASGATRATAQRPHPCRHCQYLSTSTYRDAGAARTTDLFADVLKLLALQEASGGYGAPPAALYEPSGKPQATVAFLPTVMPEALALLPFVSQ